MRSRRLMVRAVAASPLDSSSKSEALFLCATSAVPPPTPKRANAVIISVAVGTRDRAEEVDGERGFFFGARPTRGGGGGGFTPLRTCSSHFNTRASWIFRVVSPGVPLRRYASVAADDALRKMALARSSCLHVSSSKRRRSLALTLPPTPHVMIGSPCFPRLFYRGGARVSLRYWSRPPDAATCIAVSVSHRTPRPRLDTTARVHYSST